jgi:Recombination endonuclease VII
MAPRPPKASPICKRCGIRPKLPGRGDRLCEACQGHCVVCGAPTRRGAGNSYATHCAKCTPKAEFCSDCGKERDGTAYSYCAECQSKRNKRYCANNRERRIVSYRRKSLKAYGMTLEQFDILLAFQNGACPGCGATSETMVKANQFGQGNLHVDHEHRPGGIVRGLLCPRCNAAVGHADDSPELLYELADYLGRPLPNLSILPRVPTISHPYPTGNSDPRRHDYGLRFHYGITVADYDALLASQDYGCKACGVEYTKTGTRLHLDHVHDEFKAIRGILCDGCNHAIGRAMDSPAILRALADYLEDPPAPRAGVVVTVPAKV